MNIKTNEKCNIAESTFRNTIFFKWKYLSSYDTRFVPRDRFVRIAFQTCKSPYLLILWYLFADPLCKRLSDKGGQGSRLLASTGILMVAGGIATSTLFHRSRLQILSYGFLGGKNSIFLILFIRCIRIINQECHSMG
jgi:hypothetical protein